MPHLDQLLAWARTTPWAIRPDYGQTLCSILDRRARGVRLSDWEIDQLVGERRAEFEARTAAAGESRGAVAEIPILGVLTPRASLLDQSSGMTSPESIGARFDAALADPAVSTVLLDVNSPGGSIQGIPELAAKIRASEKPVVAHVNYIAASAAYWLAAQADEVIVSQSGEVGSIGVYAMHEDWTAAAEKEGVKVSLISAGKYKTEGSRFAPFSDEARAALQQQVDEAYGMFTGDVAKGRGVSRAVASGPKFGEGRIVMAQDALAAGMVDRISTYQETKQRLLGGGRVKRRMRSESDVVLVPDAAAETTVHVTVASRAGPDSSTFDDADLLELEVLAAGGREPSRAATLSADQGDPTCRR